MPNAIVMMQSIPFLILFINYDIIKEIMHLIMSISINIYVSVNMMHSFYKIIALKLNADMAWNSIVLLEILPLSGLHM
jgi:hypothetical protein